MFDLGLDPIPLIGTQRKASMEQVRLWWTKCGEVEVVNDSVVL